MNFRYLEEHPRELKMPAADEDAPLAGPLGDPCTASRKKMPAGGGEEGRRWAKSAHPWRLAGRGKRWPATIAPEETRRRRRRRTASAIHEPRREHSPSSDLAGEHSRRSTAGVFREAGRPLGLGPPDAAEVLPLELARWPAGSAEAERTCARPSGSSASQRAR